MILEDMMCIIVKVSKFLYEIIPSLATLKPAIHQTIPAININEFLLTIQNFLLSNFPSHKLNLTRYKLIYNKI